MNPQNEIYIKLLRKLEAETEPLPEKRDEFNPNKCEIEAAKQLSCLTKVYLKPLLVLRSFGNHPLFITKVKYGDTDIIYRQFDIKIMSMLTLYSVLTQIFYISGFSLLSYRCLSGTYRASIIPGSAMRAKHGTATADGLVTAFFCIFFLACCGGAAVSFWSSRKLTNFLNRWKEFVFLFSKAFPEQSLNFSSLESFNYRVLTFSVLISSTYLIWSPYIYRTCLFDFDGSAKCTRYEIEQSILFAGFGCSSILNLTWEQYKLALMLRTVGIAFQQIGNALVAHKEQNRPFNPKMLREMFKITYIAREQAKLASKIVGTSQLFVLFYLFGLTIIIWMMGFQLTGGDLSLSLVLIISSIGAVQFCRFAATTLLVENILSGEKRIVEQVSDLKPDSLKGQIEIQIFLNVLTKRPSEFVLNDFITYKRSLFLAILSNCTSYLIAFQQLIDASNTEQSTATTSQISGANTSLTPS